jgi:GTP-binding protein
MLDNLPVVAVIGRPNVGKSTLYNRLVRKRQAIIDPTPGVTRDLLYGTVEWDDISFIVIDSGGLTDETDEINKYVQDKSRFAIDDSDLVLFMVEAGKPLPIEEEYLDMVRRSGKPCIIVMNKSDSPEKDVHIHDYYKYGLGEPVPISATHNRNIETVMHMIADKLPAVKHEEKELEVNVNRLSMAILGKPNVGKSSLLNKLLHDERSIVSSIPGTTRDVVDGYFEFDERVIHVLDTAGIRRKKKVFEDIEYYSVNRAIKTIEDADVVLLLIDSTEELSDQDKKIADLIVKQGKGLVLVMNKWDLQNQNEKELRKKSDRLRFKFPVLHYVPIHAISAKTGTGIKALVKTVISIYDQINMKISTADLNRFIKSAMEANPPKYNRGFLKIYYCVQTSSAPIEFVFFINKKRLMTSNYKQYLVNRFRDEFGFTGIPITVNFKDKKRKLG